jgi:hypothetical protein
LSDSKSSANIKVTGVFNGESNIESQLSKLDELEDNECLEVTYEGNTDFSSPIYLIEKDKFLKNSKWVINDDKIKWLFDSQGTNNRPKTFKHQIEYSKIADLMSNVSKMAELDLPVYKKGGGASYDLKKKSDELSKIERIFEVEFA